MANFEFDVVVGADGRRNTLEGEATQTVHRCFCVHFMPDANTYMIHDDDDDEFSLLI